MDIIYSSDNEKNPKREELQKAYADNKAKCMANNDNIIAKTSSTNIFSFPTIQGKLNS